MKRTGTFATSQEIEIIKSIQSTPLVALNAGMPQSALEVAHNMALSHGLPEVKGYYGIDLINGEFLAAD